MTPRRWWRRCWGGCLGEVFRLLRSLPLEGWGNHANAWWVGVMVQSDWMVWRKRVDPHPPAYRPVPPPHKGEGVPTENLKTSGCCGVAGKRPILLRVLLTGTHR